MKSILNKYLKAVKDIVPEQDSTSSVGLDIGLKSCRMVEVKGSGDSLQLTNWAIEPIIDGDKKGAVKNILDKTLLPTTAPKTSIFGKGTLIRYIDMPRMTLEDLKKSFALEADKYFPFPASQIYTDCYILDPKGKANKMSVLVAAAKKEIINERIDLLTALGFQADFVGIDSIAIANVFNVMGLNERGDTKLKEDVNAPGVAVLDMGENVSNLTILEDGHPHFTRDIFVGGRELTRSISNALGIGIEEAEQLKCAPKEKLSDVLNASDSAILNLVSELRLSFDYFITERNTSISQLLVTGGASMLAGLPDMFAKYLEVPVQKWNSIEGVPLAPEVAVEDVSKNTSRLGVALGLALYQ